MNKTRTKTIRFLVLLVGLILAAYMIWRLLTGAELVGFSQQSQGPLIIVVFGLVLLCTLGAAFSFFANQHLSSTMFLGGLLTLMAFVLWLRQPGQADLYRLYFIYGLLVLLLSPLVLDHH